MLVKCQNLGRIANDSPCREFLPLYTSYRLYKQNLLVAVDKSLHILKQLAWQRPQRVGPLIY
jgi:hypothetical protein